jgi:hypothetical protein
MNFYIVQLAKCKKIYYDKVEFNDSSVQNGCHSNQEKQLKNILRQLHPSFCRMKE